MANEMLVRAWKDEEYRLGLSETERAMLAENPAGSLELSDAELDLVAGGHRRRRSIEITVNCGVTVLICGLGGTAVCDTTFKVEFGS
jgi:mersacidin/lichenicidin family type 2 lantibiotic